jgi:23S rRNA pseudouridine2605 synthase
MISLKRQDAGQVSIVRALSKLGYASRSLAEALVDERRVAINGRIVTSPHTWLDLRTDRIALDGKPLHRRQEIYLAMNKPRGIVTTRADERHRRTVYDLLPASDKWVFPVGRLDKDSGGLLLLTNDVRFGEGLTNPDRHIQKVYRVRLDRPLAEDHRRVMESGMVLDNGTVLRPVEVRFPGGDHCLLTMTLAEGKNRQIRKMAESLGYVVQDLLRIGIGDVRLGMLKEGEVRALTPGEVASLNGGGWKERGMEGRKERRRGDGKRNRGQR